MAESTGGDWVSYTEAGSRLGLTPDAIRHRVKKGSMLGTRSNSGKPLVYVGAECPETSSRNSGTEYPESAEAAEIGAAGVVPLIMALLERERAEVRQDREAIERRHEAAIAAERAETARRISEIQTIHLDLVNRLQAQGALERSMWMERVDAAEVRAERVEQRLDDVLDHLLQRQANHEPWWKRWFGSSRRSEISRG